MNLFIKNNHEPCFLLDNAWRFNNLVPLSTHRFIASVLSHTYQNLLALRATIWNAQRLERTELTDTFLQYFIQ